MAKWILLREDGSIAGQVQTKGARTPADDGSNPDGLREVQVNSHSDDVTNEWFDEATRRWKVRPERVPTIQERTRLQQLRETFAGDRLLERLADNLAELRALKDRVAALERQAASPAEPALAPTPPA